MTNIVNGLAATRTRVALLREIHENVGRFYFEAGDVWDKARYMRVTARVKEFVQHGWLRALSPDEPRRKGESKRLTYYRVTELGLQVLAVERGRNRG